eukprot:2113114-Rhodomonas_salina.1
MVERYRELGSAQHPRDPRVTCRSRGVALDAPSRGAISAPPHKGPQSMPLREESRLAGTPSLGSFEVCATRRASTHEHRAT